MLTPEFKAHLATVRKVQEWLKPLQGFAEAVEYMATVHQGIAATEQHRVEVAGKVQELEGQAKELQALVDHFPEQLRQRREELAAQVAQVREESLRQREVLQQETVQLREQIQQETGKAQAQLKAEQEKLKGIREDIRQATAQLEVAREAARSALSKVQEVAG